MLSEAKTVGTAEYLMNCVRIGFATHHSWAVIESEASRIISRIRKGNELATLAELKEKLVGLGASNEDVKFIDDESELCQTTHTLEESETVKYLVSEDEADKYIRVCGQKDGMVSINAPYSFEQTKNLSFKIYQKTGAVKFFISPEKRYSGRVVSEIYELPQKVPIVSVIRKISSEDSETKPRLAFFGEKFPESKYAKISDLQASFRVYRFVTADDHEFMLLSKDSLKIGDYIVGGMSMDMDDFKSLTDSFRLKTKMPFLFVHKAQSKVIKFNNSKQLVSRVEAIGLSEDDFLDYPFTAYQMRESRRVRLLHPRWFKTLVWSWMLHAPEGLQNPYPMHLMMVADPSTGKSTLLESMSGKCMETKTVFSGSNSTLKSVVPSFKYTPVKIGYLLECSRFAFMDEFLRCIAATRGGSDLGTRDESLAMLNDLLEHRKREAGSGVSSVKVNMTARAFAASNPIRDTGSMVLLLQKFDQSFMSRWIVYFQSKDHIQMIQRCDKKDLMSYDANMDVHDFISIIDFMQNSFSEWDAGRVSEIFEEPKAALPDLCLSYYSGRYKHHIDCLIDGIIKLRCILQKDPALTAKEEDYEALREVWGKVIGSWMSPEEVMRIPLGSRIDFMPEKCQYVYQKLLEMGGSSPLGRLISSVSSEMNSCSLTDSVLELKRAGIVEEVEGRIVVCKGSNAHLQDTFKNLEKGLKMLRTQSNNVQTTKEV